MSIRIGKINFSFSFSFFAVLSLMLLFSEKEIAFICFFSSMLHELGHLGLMLWFKEPVVAICFGAFGVRIERSAVTMQSYKNEGLIALGGIIINLAVALVSVAFYLIFSNEKALLWLLVNLFLALLNLMPGCQLDFGRVLYCFLASRRSEEQAETITEKISNLACVCFTLFCVWFFFAIGVNYSLACVCVYFIILNGKRRNLNDKQRS